MKCKIFGLLVLFLVLLPLLVVQAQVQPTSGVIPFSGTIPGQPDGPVDLRLRLFPVASGGTQCFEETQTVQVTTETFFAFIGDATTGGVPPDPCFTTNPSLWIAFALDGTPDTEIGARTSITSSGYAHFALGVTDNAVATTTIQDSAVTSAKIAASSVDSSKIVDGSIGVSQVDSTQVQRRVIGSCDVGNAIQVVNADGTVTCQAVGTGTIDGGGTANFIPRFTGTTTIGNTAISVVGNTITTPLAITGPLTVSPNSTSFALRISQGINGDGIQTYVNTTSGTRTVLAAHSNVVGLQVNGDGRVGIGTTSPIFKLDVSSSRARLATSSGTDGPFFNLNHGGEVGGRSWFIGTAGTANSAGLGKFTIFDGTAGLDRMVIDGSGNVGIGKLPVAAYKLDVAGKVLARQGFNGTCIPLILTPPPGFPFSVICNQDVAETFASLEATEPGDLVVLVNQSASMPTVRKSTRPYEGLLVGAVSTNPGLVFDRGETLLAGDNSKLITSEKTVVGLVGRVPVKVSLENGPIAVGDPLTSSSTEGVAMRATKAGQIVGYALEKADQKGKILVHLQPGYYIPPKQLALLNQIDELKAQVSELQGLFQAVLAQGPEK